MTPQQFRKIALSLPNTIESQHMGHPDFRVNGKIFATLGAPTDEFGMVKLTPEQQSAYCSADAEAFQRCNGAWGKQGCTFVKLAAVKTAVVRSALVLAIENAGTPQSQKKLPQKHRRQDFRASVHRQVHLAAHNKQTKIIGLAGNH
jgi:YjbR